MANDELPGSLDPHVDGEQPRPRGTRRRRRPRKRASQINDSQPFRTARRHRDDRRIAEPPREGWDHLPAVQADNPSWPLARLN